MAKHTDTAVLVRVMDDTGFNQQTIAKVTGAAQSKQAVPLLSDSIAAASSFLIP